jgi:hypothetical protein
MKKLSLAFVLFALLLLTSCKTTDESLYLKLSTEATTLEKKTDYSLTGLSKYPDNFKYIYNSAYYLSLEKCYKEAESVIFEGLEKYPEAIQLYTLLAHLYKTRGMLRSYEDTMLKILEIDPAHSEAAHTLLEHLIATHRKTDAAALAHTLYERDVTDLLAINALAYLEGGMFLKIKTADIETKMAETPAQKPCLPPLDIKIDVILNFFQSQSLSR